MVPSFSHHTIPSHLPRPSSHISDICSSSISKEAERSSTRPGWSPFQAPCGPDTPHGHSGPLHLAFVGHQFVGNDIHEVDFPSPFAPMRPMYSPFQQTEGHVLENCTVAEMWLKCSTFKILICLKNSLFLPFCGVTPHSHEKMHCGNRFVREICLPAYHLLCYTLNVLVALGHESKS